MSVAPPVVRETIDRPGVGLPDAVRSEMEPRFGFDFARVRVHHDGAAAASAAAVGAAAYTLGSHVVFGARRWAPQTPAGARLIAHELAHVVQQRGRLPAGPPPMGRPGDAGEVEADRAAAQVASGTAPAGPLSPRAPAVQRAVDATMGGPAAEPNAQVCAFSLHHDEQNSIAAARDIQNRFCANLTVLNQPRVMRWVKVEFTDPTTSTTKAVLADPNRIFNDAAITSGVPFSSTAAAEARLGSTPPVVHRPTAAQRAAILPELVTFRNHVTAAVSACSLSDTLPVIAFHNNTAFTTSDPGLTIESWRRPAAAGTLPAARSDPSSTETSAGRLPRTSTGAVAANPSILSELVVAGDPAVVGTPTAEQLDIDNFVVVTNEADFAALRGRFNVVLQRVDDPHATTPPVGSPRPTNYDDGSASIFYRGRRYFNLESENKVATTADTARNIRLAETILTHLGVPLRPAPGTPCTAPGVTLGPAVAAPRTPVTTALNFAGVTACAPAAVTYARQRDLDAQRDCWREQINRLTPSEVIEWIVGLRAPPAQVTAEVDRQRQFMLASLHADAPRIDTARDHIESGYRSSADQRTIWERKFAFTGRAFDAITTDATTGAVSPACLALAGHEGEQWTPGNAGHSACWTTLSDDIKQIQILQGSSAPGVSRHHWGTEVDLFSVEPIEWQPRPPGSSRTVRRGGRRLTRGRFVAAHGWLGNNAAEFGFVQSYNPGRAGRFPMVEQWHWSYYPISAALLAWAVALHSAPRPPGVASALEAAVLGQWSVPATSSVAMHDDPRYSFIRGMWHAFMTNVATTSPLPP